MQRILLTVAAMAGLAVGGYLGYQFLRSDEDRIRSALEEMAGSFNQRSIRHIVDHFDASYRDATIKIGKAELQAYLLYATRRGTIFTFSFDDEADEPIRIAVEGDAATVEIRGTFVRADGRHDRSGFPVEATLTWSRTDDGWKITRSEHRWARGRPR